MILILEQINNNYIKLKANLSQDKFEILDIESKEYGKLGVLKISYNKKNKIGIEQFVKKGQINLEIAIDYTKSNEPPEKENSLHYKNGKTPNDYEKAINSCVKIIAYYDGDQLFPVMVLEEFLKVRTKLVIVLILILMKMMLI